MHQTIRTEFDNILVLDRQIQTKAYYYLMDITEKPVAWAYEVWDEMVAELTHEDNHVRAISAQLLCNLAKSDPKKKMLKTLPALIAVTKDERFVTARHCMQNLWKVAAAGKPQQQKLLEGLSVRFKECIKEKNGLLIRYDITECLRKVYDATKDEKVKTLSLALLETEADLKNQKKCAALWRGLVS